MKKIILLGALCVICTQAHSQSWNLNGNAGTNASTNFIGTTDAKALKFRTNNAVRMTMTTGGKIGIGTSSPVFKMDVKGGSINTDSVYRIGGNTVLSVKGNGNFFAGINSAPSNTTGSWNTSSGAFTLYSNTTGYANTTYGESSMRSNTTGFENVACGASALRNNTSGNYNSVFGTSALYSNTTGSYNTATGRQALYSNTIGIRNTAYGWQTLYSNISGSYNTATGNSALFMNNGDNNTANGYGALSGNTTGEDNTACGAYALSSNTSGINNTANGRNALISNSTGEGNTANGNNCLSANSTGNNNTASGNFANYYNTTGNINTAYGVSAMANNTIGNNNTAIGGYTSTSLPTFNNTTCLGSSATVNTSNKIRIGNTAVTVIEGQVVYSWPSDGRFKENIKEDVNGLDFIMKLQPVSYNFNRLKYAQHIREHLTADNEKSLVELSQNRSVGFIAQDVEKIIHQTGFTAFDAVHAPTNETDNYSMGYAAFVVPLVKAVQELNKTNEELKSRIEKLESLISDKTSTTHQPNNSSTFLEQNSPNPFTEKTVIKFNIPATAQQAGIKMYAADGRELCAYSISSKGAGQIEINGNTLAAGIYNYTLFIDGKATESKQMILTK